MFTYIYMTYFAEHHKYCSVKFRAVFPLKYLVSKMYKKITDLIRVGLYGGGARGSLVVKALCYKPEGRGSDSR
jgi:hypothetical protein